MGKKNIVFSLSLVATFIFSFAFTKHLRVYGASSSHQPFTLTTISYGPVDGKIQDLEETKLYSRADGATSETAKRLLQGDDWGVNTRRVNFPDGTLVFVSDDAHSKSTMRNSVQAGQIEVAHTNVPPARDPKTCALPGQQILGNEIVAGVQAYTTVSSLNSPNSSTDRLLETFLPAYGCVRVSMVQQHKEASEDKWQPHNGVRFVSLVPGAPDASKFSVDGLKEVNVTSLKQATLIAHGVTQQKCPKCFEPDYKSDLHYSTHDH